MAISTQKRKHRVLGKTALPSVVRGRPHSQVAYTAQLGRAFLGDSGELLDSDALNRFRGRINLIFTSPPFPLNRKKRYGNKQGEEYLQWLGEFGKKLKQFLAPDGSIVMEVGNSWQKGSPTMSTLSTRSLLAFQEQSDLYLCQEFVWSNPARLPGPAQWVNIERIRVKDTFTKIWWMAPSPNPKADNRKVLQPYSESMKRLLSRGAYNAGKRPSEHVVGEQSFLTENNGAIPGNVITISNTSSKDPYLKYCREYGLPLHPARMPVGLAEFFIKYLTDPNDIVLDPFAGSNVTGFAAECLSRQWISIEASKEYLEGSIGRFTKQTIGPALF